MVHLRRNEAAASEGEKRLSTIGEDNGGKLILLVGNVGRLELKNISSKIECASVHSVINFTF